MKLNMVKDYFSGTHRVCSPAETLNRIKPMMKAMGITRVANITGLDEIGIPVITVCRPQSRAVSMAQGKGLDLVSAKVSGVMEAIEVYHAEHVELPLRLASYRELKRKNRVVDVDQLPKLSIRCFNKETSILWIEGIDLRTDTTVFVPYEIAHSDYSLPLPTGSGYFMMSTNGLASGNHYLEAVIHGVCELIERDAVFLWNLQRRGFSEKEGGARRLDLSTVDDTDCLKVLARFKKAGVNVGVWNVTSDVEIPTFYCTIMDEQDNPYRFLSPATGMGSHPSKSVALLRALTEAAQSRLTIISGSRDDISVTNYEEKQKRRAQDETRLELENKNARCDFTSISSWENKSFEEDLQLILTKLGGVGLDQVVVVNLEKSEFGIAVVRVVVPGLEGISGVAGLLMGERGQKIRKQRNEEVGQ